MPHPARAIVQHSSATAALERALIDVRFDMRPVSARREPRSVVKKKKYDRDQMHSRGTNRAFCDE